MSTISISPPARMRAFAVAALAAIVAALGICGATGATQSADAATVRALSPSQVFEWNRGEAGMPQVNRRYFLTNTRNNGVLGYQSRPLGINLGWVARNGPGNFTFSRANGHDTARVRPGEAVALRNTTGGFVAYGQRRWGINLVWSSTPKYQWKVGMVGNLMALHNSVANDYVVYARRPVGINLCWSKDVRTVPGVGRVCAP
jgi:hypothetical protein